MPPDDPVAGDAVSMGSGREFDLIRRLVDRWGGAARGIGDDAAIVDVPAGARLVASTDTSLEDVHFRRAWMTPQEIGYRAMASAISDLAAMAAAPLGALIAITAPERMLEEMDSLADGLAEAAVASQCPITGGDLTRGDTLSVTVSVLGHAVAPVRRSGGRAADLLYVTGTLGGPGAALLALASDRRPDPMHRARLAHPVPRLAEARWLAARGATAMIDISDGLVSDVGHLASASAVAVGVELDRLPLVNGVTQMEAACSGEEYELLVLAPQPLDESAFAQQFGVPLTRIGQVSKSGAAGVTFTLAGARVDPGSGYDHFSI